MNTRGHRRTVATLIYQDRHGFEVRVPGFSLTVPPKRYPPNASMEQMQEWQAEERLYRLRQKADDDAQQPVIARGTLTADVTRYLETRVGREGYKSDRSHLHAWELAFGSRPRQTIKRHDCEKQIGKWLEAGKSAKTIRHRVRVLRELFHTLDGRRARTPVDDLTRSLPRVPKRSPTPVDEAIILSVADSLLAGKRHAKGYGGDSDKAHARFLIRALSGQRPSQIGRALPAHIDREKGIWWVTAGKGGHFVPFPLIEELDLAFQLFDKVHAWGKFDARSFSKTIKRHGWPATTRPYALRHNFAIKQLLSGTDLGDLQGLLGHTNPTTTRIYAPVLVARLREAVQRGTPLKLVKKTG